MTTPTIYTWDFVADGLKLQIVVDITTGKLTLTALEGSADIKSLWLDFPGGDNTVTAGGNNNLNGISDTSIQWDEVAFVSDTSGPPRLLLEGQSLEFGLASVGGYTYTKGGGPNQQTITVGSVNWSNIAWADTTFGLRAQSVNGEDSIKLFAYPPVTVDLFGSLDSEGDDAAYTFTATLSAAARGVTTIVLKDDEGNALGSIFIAEGSTTGEFRLPSTNVEDVYIDASSLTAVIASAASSNSSQTIVPGVSTATSFVDDTETPVTVSIATSDVKENQASVFRISVNQALLDTLEVTLDNGDKVTIEAGQLWVDYEMEAQGDDVYVDPGFVTLGLTSAVVTGKEFEKLILGDPATSNITDTIDDTVISLTTDFSSYKVGDIIVITADLGANKAQSPIELTLGYNESTQVVVIDAEQNSGTAQFVAGAAGTGEVKVTSVSGNGNFENLVTTVVASFNVEDIAPSYQGLSHGYWRNHGPNAPGKQGNDWDKITGSYDGKGGESFEFLIWGAKKEGLGWSITTGSGRNAKTTTKDDITMMEALSLGGGGQNALAREAVAAILNARDEDVNYFKDEQWIVGAVRNAFAGQGEYSISALHTLLEQNNTLGLV